MNAKETSPRLGRGLAALLGDTAASAADAERGAVVALGIADLRPSPFQPRTTIDPVAIEELATSIRARGVLQPLLVRPDPEIPGRYQIIAGERRWRAAQAAGIHEIPVIVRDLTDSDAMVVALVENLQRQDLNAIEEADGYRRLLEEFGVTQESLGQSVGKSRSHIANTLRLLNLPGAVQNEVRKGTLSAGHARALLAHPEPEKAALAVIARQLNVRQTEALVKRASAPESAPGGAPGNARQAAAKDPETEALAHSLSERLGLRVEIAFNGRTGTLSLHYRSLDQLDGIITLLSRE
uniref:ParB/RepB/Spo0J family partition protein n=1 Tax=Acidicaldus sp. TaxID=1872105 RepID=A0A8J4H7R4_9PROT